MTLPPNPSAAAPRPQPAPPPDRPRGKPIDYALNWMPTIVFTIVLPWLTYVYLTNHGMSQAPALMIAGIWPALETLGTLAIRRKVDE
ncbi:MAG: hypothetical protein J2O49_00065, partial [Sciscionella sp.]|nr:hypothetical protein [Sciscionella sp.]